MATSGFSMRSLLAAFGIGDFNATAIIPYMMMGPTQTDPQMGQIVLLTTGLQQTMQAMGARATVTGSIDSSWAPYFRALAGAGWMGTTWFELARLLLEAKEQGLKFSSTYSTDPQVVELGDTGPFGLPDIPGGILTYAIGGFLLWRHFRSK